MTDADRPTTEPHEHHWWCQTCEITMAEAAQGAAPQPEGLDYGEIWERWEEFADMAARSGSGFTQDQITGAAAMLTWLIDHEDRSIR